MRVDTLLVGGVSQHRLFVTTLSCGAGGTLRCARRTGSAREHRERKSQARHRQARPACGPRLDETLDETKSVQTT